MEQNDAQLIQQVLQGDQEAFSSLVKKYQQGGSRARLAEDRRFSYRTGNHTRRVSPLCIKNSEP